MTGYGAAEARVPLAGRDLRVRVDVRAVNHRFLDVRTRIPPALTEHVAALEELAGKRLRRGRIEIGVRVDGRLEPAPVLDVGVARAAFEQLRALRDELAPGEPMPFGLLSSVPGLFVPGVPEEGGALREALADVLGRACEAVDTMRLREGSALAEDLSTRLESMRAKLAQIRHLAPGVVASQRTRLRDRVARVLGDVDAPLDEVRLEHEVALFAERTDVAEEVARIGAHCDQFDELMHATGPAHGRKLDFLLQELAREVNTLGAKTPEIEITRIVVELKADIERLREQVQNIL